MSKEEQIEDIFEREQVILDHVVKQSNLIKAGQEFDIEEYHTLVKEYGRLLKQLRRLTKIYDKTTENLNMRKQDLLDQVQYDALSGIYNRRYLEDTLKRTIKSMSRAGDQLSVMMIDVDFFKRYNDTYGHSEGDECLKRVAKTIAASLTRADDFVARFGGEEFVVVLPNTDESGARVMANRILENMRAQNIPHEKNDAASCITVSIGVTTANVTFTQTTEDYIKEADKAMYQSKNSGRNRYTFIDFKGDKHDEFRYT